MPMSNRFMKRQHNCIYLHQADVGRKHILVYIMEILIALCFFVIGFFGILAVHLYFEQRS